METIIPFPLQAISMVNFRLSNVVNYLLFAAGCVCLVGGVIAVFEVRAGNAAILLGLSIALFFAATIDRFESLKGFGVEATQRKVVATLNEANEVLEQVQQLSFFTTKSLVTIYARIGRLVGPPSSEETYEVLQQFTRNMRNADAQPEELALAIKPCTDILIFDYWRGLIRDLLTQVEDQGHALNQNINHGGLSAEQREEESNKMMSLHLIRAQLREYRPQDDSSFPTSVVNTLLRTHPLSQFPTSAEAADSLLMSNAEIEKLRSRGKLDDPSAWFRHSERADY